MGTIEKIYQALIKVFVRSNKRFPVGKELQDLEKQAREVFDGALNYNLDQAKGKNLDDIVVMEQTTEKSGDQLIDDYLSNEANKGRLTSEPTFTQVDERKLPKAEIESMDLKDPKLKEQSVRKKLEAQNVQAKQSKEGGETPGGPQRGRPEVVDENFRDTIYIDKSEMQKLTDQAWRHFDAAERAMAEGKFDDARTILKYEIADNYQFPANIRYAADDARNMIDRNGLVWKEMGYDSYDEGLEAFNEKISKGQQQTMEDNWVDFTDPLEPEKQKSQRIEYVSFFDEPGEDFGTPNDSISDISKLFYNYKKGGPVKKKKPVIDPKDKGPFDDIFKKMYSEYEWEKKKKSYKDGFATGGKVVKRKGFWAGDTGDMGSEADNAASTSAGADSVGAGDGSSGPSDTGDLGSEAANDAATSSGADSVGAGGFFSPYSKTGQMRTNLQNFARANPTASFMSSLVFGPFVGPMALAYANVYGQPGKGGITSSTAGGEFIEEEEQLAPFTFPQADLSTFYALRDQYRKDYMPYKYESGGRVGFSNGGIKGKLIEIINKISKSRRVKQSEAEDFAKLLDDMEQARKAGIIDEAGFKSLQRGIESMRDAAYGSRMTYPTGVPGGKSALPVDDKDLVPKTNLGLMRNKIKKDREGIQSLADDDAIPVRDDTVKPKYRFTGRETLNDLRDLEDKGIVSRADINVYGDRYLDYLDAKVKYTFGYTKGQMNKIQNQPARLNHLRAKVDPDWGEANFGSDYLRILEKERGVEASGGTPEFSRQKTKSKDKLLIPTKKDVEEISDEEISKAYNEALLGNDLDGSDKKYDAQVIADYLSQDRYKKDFYDLPQSIQLDLYEKSWKWLNEGFIENLFEMSKPMKGPIDMKTGKNILTGKKVMDVDYIPGEEPLTPKPKKTPRKDNAKGGLNYLMGF